jgi:hypothetical protein
MWEMRQGLGPSNKAHSAAVLLTSAAHSCCSLLLPTAAAAHCCCMLLLPAAAARCCCRCPLPVLLLLHVAAAHCCCALLLRIAAAHCCCQLLLLFLQVGPDSLRSNTLTGLLVQLAKRDAFNTLRTQQQLGYIVHMWALQGGQLAMEASQQEGGYLMPG